jgi:hypothetical protein
LKLELFSSIKVGSNMKFLHTFGCPVFDLNNSLASSKAIPRWDPRARLGLNLGPSPTHARNVHLVLSLTTGLVSPQFHVRFDDFFETVKYGTGDAGIASTWQRLTGFKRGQGNKPVLHTSDGLLRQPQILHGSASHDSTSAPQGSTSDFLETFSDTASAEPPFHEEFSDVTPRAPRQGSHPILEALQPQNPARFA